MVQTRAQVIHTPRYIAMYTAHSLLNLLLNLLIKWLSSSLQKPSKKSVSWAVPFTHPTQDSYRIWGGGHEGQVRVWFKLQKLCPIYNGQSILKCVLSFSNNYYNGSTSEDCNMERLFSHLMLTQTCLHSWLWLKPTIFDGDYHRWTWSARHKFHVILEICCKRIV